VNNTPPAPRNTRHFNRSGAACLMVVAPARLASPLCPPPVCHSTPRSGPRACLGLAGPDGSSASWPPASTPTFPVSLAPLRRPQVLHCCRQMQACHCCARHLPGTRARWPGRAAAPPRAERPLRPAWLRSLRADPQRCAPAMVKDIQLIRRQAGRLWPHLHLCDMSCWLQEKAVTQCPVPSMSTGLTSTVACQLPNTGCVLAAICWPFDAFARPNPVATGARSASHSS